LNNSKIIVNNFNLILSDVATEQAGNIESAMLRLRAMLDIFTHFAQRYELLEISDHIRRVFDLMLNSTFAETFGQILDMADDMKVSPIKIEILRVIGLLSIGGKLFG
jgi:hypothetical protein